MKHQKYASVRYKSRSSALVPFRDDISLISLRYDQVKAREPPIPFAPPRSPLQSRSTGVSAHPGAPLLTFPPLRHPPPTEQHPALRTITNPVADNTYSTYSDDDSKRDSGHAPTTSPTAFTFYEESDEEEDDPFPYEKVESVPEVRVIPDDVYVHANEISRLPGLRSRARSPSLYSENEKPCQHHQVDVLRGTNNNSQCSISIPTPGLSDANSNTVSPTTPITPHPDFLDKPASFFSRSFSFRSSRTSTNSRRLRKKSLPQTMETPGIMAGPDATPVNFVNVPSPVLAPAGNTASPPPALEPYESEYSGREFPIGPLESPGLTTATSTKTTDNGEFSDFVTHMSFSKRGSIILGGQRPTRNKKGLTMNTRDSGIGNELVKEQPVPRAFPLAPSSSLPKSQVDGAAHSAQARSDANANDKKSLQHTGDAIAEEDEDDANQTAHSVSLIATPPVGSSTPAPFSPPPSIPTADKVVEAPSTPKSPQPPSIRVLSVDVERESQKVRSLYESGEGLRWEDGGRLAPTKEVPSDVDEDENENAASPQNPSQQSQSLSPSDRTRNRTGARGIPASVASTASRRDDSVYRAYELAGGIEDWEDVSVEDVDRYGFISARRPGTRSSTPAELEKLTQFSPRKQRNVLVRKESSHSVYLGIRRPNRKTSARSLNTQASEMSTTSRLSSRSAVRQAANLLPHNRDRRWMDEAGEMLSLEPGMSIGDDESAGKLAEEYKRKEWSRADKWRKMAKVIKPGKDGEGMVFEFDMKDPKLVERTWKGIPDMWRAAAWSSFLSSSARNSKKPYDTDEELIAEFGRLQEQPSPDDVQIDLDVPRTINQHIMFRKRYRGGQRLLFRVLHALSLYFPNTGYVQGMASLAATLLNYYDEENCFVMLVRMWQLRGMNRLYQPGFEELMGALSDFEKYWLGDKDVAKKLHELCIDPTAYGTRWYLTLFNLSIPFPAQLRVWDVFMLLGESPPDPPDSATPPGKETPEHVSSKGLEILHATSAAIIHALHDHLVDSEFENAMKALTSWVPIKDGGMLMKVVRAEYKQHQSKSKKT